MTTIAYKDGVMAADTQITFGDGSRSRVKKIRRLPDGSLFGGCGDAPTINKLERWASVDLVRRRRPRFDKKEDADGLIVRPDGSIWLVGVLIDPEKLEIEFASIGSGSKYALGAMSFGACAAEAIKIAAEFDSNTSGPIERLLLKTT